MRKYQGGAFLFGLASWGRKEKEKGPPSPGRFRPFRPLVRRASRGRSSPVSKPDGSGHQRFEGGAFISGRPNSRRAH